MDAIELLARRRALRHLLQVLEQLRLVHPACASVVCFDTGRRDLLGEVLGSVSPPVANMYTFSSRGHFLLLLQVSCSLSQGANLLLEGQNILYWRIACIVRGL
jgi:hypothetical protein